MSDHFRLGLMWVVVITLAQCPVRGDSLDDTIGALMQKRNIPGLSLAVVQDGRIVKAKGYGVTESSGTIPVTEATLFQAGSVSKPVAAFGALRLVDAGKLSLDADVNTTLKTWKVPENEFTKTEHVTLRRLLSHTAGLTVNHFPGYAVDEAKPTLIQVLNGEKPANTEPVRVDLMPGSKTNYSGGGYAVMQQMVIDVTGQPFPTVMSDSVLKPLGMLDSTYEQPIPATMAGGTAAGHYAGAKPVPGRWHVYPEMAAGLWTTPSDLARFIIGVQQSLAGKPGALLPAPSARRMVTVEKESFGLGFMVSGTGSSERFMHDGRDDGFDTQLAGYCQTGQGAVIMINANENSSFMKQVLAAIVREYHWPDFVPYTPPQPIEDNEPQVTAQVRTIVEQAQAGTFERALYTERLGASLAARIQQGDSVRQLRAMGATKSVILIGKKVDGSSRSYRYFVVLEKDALLVSCTYDQDGKIAGLSFQPE